MPLPLGQRISTEYEHIVSLGYFCGVALELERIGLRDASGPFDWVIAPWAGVAELLTSGFDDLFEADAFEQDPRTPEHYRNSKYGIAFYHDFDRWISFDAQLPNVREKYERRIERFYANASDPTLFVRYVRDENEVDELRDTLPAVISLLRELNCDNDVLLVGNDSLDPHLLNYVFACDEGDVVARRFLDNSPELAQRLINGFPDERRKKNLAWYSVKESRKANSSAACKLKRASLEAKKILVPAYRHSRIAEEAF